MGTPEQMHEFWGIDEDALKLSNKRPVLVVDLYSTDSNFASDPKLVMKIKPLFTNPEYSLEGLMLKLQYFAHLM